MLILRRTEHGRPDAVATEPSLAKELGYRCLVSGTVESCPLGISGPDLRAHPVPQASGKSVTGYKT
jgi:hypothetical protein